jgi:hypothetical protein
MASKPSFTSWLRVLITFKNYWMERLGATFKVGDVDYAGLETKCAAFEESIGLVDKLYNQIQEARALRNQQAEELHLLLRNLKKQVEIIKGKNSPEFAAFPRLVAPPKDDDTPLGPPPGATTPS